MRNPNEKEPGKENQDPNNAGDQENKEVTGDQSSDQSEDKSDTFGLDDLSGDGASDSGDDTETEKDEETEEESDEGSSDEDSTGNDSEYDESEGDEGSDDEVQSEGKTESGGPSEDELFEKVTEAAKLEIQRRTGEEYDEFNPKHIVMLNRISNKIFTEIDQAKAAQKSAMDFYDKASKMISTKELKAFVSEKWDNIPRKRYQEILNAEARGDFSLTEKFLSDCKDEFDGKSSNTEKAKKKVVAIQKRNASNPPALEGSGNGYPGTENDGDDNDDALALFFGG